MLDVLRFIYTNLDEFRRRFHALFLIGILYGASSFLVGFVLARFTERDFTLERFRILVPTLIGVYITYLFLAWIIRRYGEALASQFEHHIRLKYFRALESLPIERMINLHSGYMLSLINNIGAGTKQVIFTLFWSISGMIAHLTLFFGYVSQQSFTIAVLNLVVLGMFVAASVVLARKMVVYNRELNLKSASLLESYSDFMTNILTIKKLAISAFAERRLSEKTQTVYDQIHVGQSFHAKRWFLLHALYAVAFIGTILYFLFLVASGAQSIAILLLFVIVYGTMRFHMERLSEALKVMMETKAYVETVEETMGYREPASRENAPDTWHTIRLEDIEFSYHEQGQSIHIPEFVINRGEKISIQGVSGQGKTTTLHLLSNAFAHGKGRRVVDDRAFQDIPQSFFDRTMVIISQEVELFNVSLRENITLGKSMTDEQIFELLDELDLGAWVRDLDKGLETIVGEKGVKLSVGQKQRINLLRGVLLDRDILLLDEPTAHLDHKTEKRVIDFLARELKNKTVVIVTHRPELLTLCSRQYAMKEHTLVEVADNGQSL
ncbi:MAG: ABC transporter ATP-binding protein [Candidatus Kerfeldbacteria bacterium]|nr:ABC transporter ATP-binding protein [Candidatus Kerfeldbacteria bacterium]